MGISFVRLWSLVIAIELICPLACHAADKNRIIALVEEDVITEADVEAYWHSWLQDPEQPIPKELDPSQARRLALRQLIEERLLLQEAKRSGVTVTTEEVLNRVKQLEQQAGSEAAFRESLKKAGLSPESLKERLRQQLMVQQLIDQRVRSTIIVSPYEVATAVKENPNLASGEERIRTAHILIRIDQKRSEKEALQLAESLHQKLEEGADFAELAQRYSEEPQAAQGGELGWVKPAELLSELDESLFKLQEGEYSKPVRTQLGVHLLKALERESDTKLSPQEVNQAASRKLYQQKFQEAMARLIKELGERAYIEVVTDL
ncbi:MAG: peptidylprolyl isomerase [Candidatus Omnitrophica bacterium]|nr:peptidylprolyl isomerase [Candidatus Omnitrophota bacterium]